jgi:hypothetical protein
MATTVEVTSTGQVLVTQITEQAIEVQAPSSPLTVEVVTAGAQGPAAPSLPRSITIAGPQPDDSFTFFRTVAETNISSVTGLVSNGSVSYELRYGADRTTAGTLAATDTVTNTTTGDSATLQNQPVPAGRYVWVNILAVSGIVSEFNVSIGF